MALPTLEQLIGAGITESQFKSALQLLLENIESVEATTLRISNAKNEAITTAENDATTKADGALSGAKTYTDDEISGLDTAIGTKIQNVESSLNRIIDRIVSEVRSKIFSDPASNNIFDFTDKDGEVVALIDPNSQLFLAGLTKSVQVILKELIRITELFFTYSDQENAFIFTDSEGEMLMKIGLDGKCHIVGLDTDLVTYIKNISAQETDTSIALNRKYVDTFTTDTQSVLNSLQYAETGALAPAPLHLFKHNFKTNKTWINDINQITFANSTRLEIDSPYRNDDGVCHPNILEFWNGFLGYRYIICITPYFNTNEAEENPCIYGSHDLIHFDLLDGFEQPLEPHPVPNFSTGHNSDNVLTYDPRSGELICIWRQTLRNPNNDGVRTDALWMRKTKNGKNWTAKELIFLSTKNTESGGAGSPAILYNVKSGYWYMYVTRLGPNSTDLRLFRAKKLHEDAWEYVSQITTPFVPWHQEVKFIGDKVVMLVYCYPPDNTLYFGISDDFQNFTWSANKYGETSCYKSSFVPEINDQNQLSLKVLYSTDAQPSATSEKWRMYMHQTNFMNVGMEII